MTKTKTVRKEWQVSDITNSENIGEMEFKYSKDGKDEVFSFTFLVTADRIVFGYPTNNGFLESGYILREAGETADKTCEELIDDIDVFYNDGAEYCSRIVCNERM